MNEGCHLDTDLNTLPLSFFALCSGRVGRFEHTRKLAGCQGGCPSQGALTACELSGTDISSHTARALRAHVPKFVACYVIPHRHVSITLGPRTSNTWSHTYNSRAIELACQAGLCSVVSHIEINSFERPPLVTRASLFTWVCTSDLGGAQ